MRKMPLALSIVLILCISSLIIGYNPAPEVIQTPEEEMPQISVPETRATDHPSVFDDFVDDGNGAMGGSSAYLIDTDIGGYLDWCKGYKLKMLSGANQDQEREIVHYNEQTGYAYVYFEYVENTAGCEGGTTTTLVDTKITTIVDGYYNGWQLNILSGPNNGQTRDVSGFDGDTGTLTVTPAFGAAITAGTMYSISKGSKFTSPISMGDTYRIYLTDYDMQNIYFLCCQNMTQDIHYLDLTPHISNGDSSEITGGGFNKENINTSIPLQQMNFSYPRPGMAQKGKGLFCEFDETSTPFCNISINTMWFPAKQLGVEVWFDTDGDYNIVVDGGDLTKIEGIMDFDFDPVTPDVQPFTTLVDISAEPFREEFADGLGVWRQMPAANEKDMNSGQIFVILRRVDTQPDNWPFADFLAYCGYTAKISWISLPYKHALVEPVAEAGVKAATDEGPYQDYAGFNDTRGQIVIREREDVLFSADKSYDPQDDDGGDGLAFGDPGWTGKNNDFEDNKNIDDGVPEGEVDIGEVSTVQYRWKWGAGTQTSAWSSSPYITHSFRVPALYEYEIFEVTLEVRDEDMNIGRDKVWVKVWKDPGVPPLATLTLKPDENQDDDEATVLVNQEFIVSGYGTDPDPGQTLSYYWDLDNTDIEHEPDNITEFLGEKDKNTTTTFTMKFDTPGDYRLTLNVFDGPWNDTENTFNTTDYIILHVVENTPPEGEVFARIANTSMKYSNQTLEVRDSQNIQFKVEAMDPDLRPGYDLDKDYVIDYQIQYKWDWGDGKTSDWTMNSEMVHNYSGKGSPDNDYQYYSVKVQVRDGDPLDTNTKIFTTAEFKIFVNLAPFAEAGPHLPNINYITQEIEEGDVVYFDGNGSYDPNDDIDNSEEIDGDEVDTLYYRWNFGDGSEVGEGKQISHVYEKAGEYTVVLDVFDTGGRTAQDSTTVTIRAANVAPVAQGMIMEKDNLENKLEGDNTELTVYTSDDVIFDASESYDPDGTAYTDDKNSTLSYKEDLTFVWNFGLDNSSTTSSYYSIFSYPQDGLYLVTLTVTDKSHEKTVTVTKDYTVHVLNRKPTASVKGEAEGVQDETSIFDGGKSSDVDGNVVAYSWEWGDELKDPWSNSSTASHAYEQPGVYTVKLFVKDDDGAVSEAVTMNITINPPKKKDEGSAVPGFTTTMFIYTMLALVILGSVGITASRRRRK